MAFRKHVLFVSVPPTSHITSLLHIARKVANYHDVTFVVTAARIPELRERGLFTQDDEKVISLVGLNDGITNKELNDSTTAGMGVMMYRYRDTLVKLMATFPVTGGTGVLESQPVERQTVEPQPVDREITQPVDVFFVDRIMSVFADPVLDRGVPVIIFVPSAGFTYSNKINVDEKTPVLPDDAFFSDWEAHPDVSRIGMPDMLKGVSVGFNAVGGVSERVHALVFNSIAELEPQCVEILRTHPTYVRAPLRFVAPLFETKSKENDSRSKQIMDWLDKQQERSVVYVSFGTMAVSKKEQLQEIAKALLLLKRPFIWGLRQEEHQHLPEEIQENRQDFLIVPWTPQRELLQHKAIAVFLSHAGWNSYMESMDCGVPMVAWPLFGDHFGAANMVAEAGAGVRIQGTSMLFINIISAETICEAVLRVGEWKTDAERTVEYGKNARQVGELIKRSQQPGGSSYQAFMDLVDIDIGRSEITGKTPKR